jgi:uncharacterized membrane protein YdcZ (DUF606 family)
VSIRLVVSIISSFSGSVILVHEFILAKEEFFTACESASPPIYTTFLGALASISDFICGKECFNSKIRLPVSLICTTVGTLI